jgi:hypothetical protein
VGKITVVARVPAVAPDQAAPSSRWLGTPRDAVDSDPRWIGSELFKCCSLEWVLIRRWMVNEQLKSTRLERWPEDSE